MKRKRIAEALEVLSPLRAVLFDFDGVIAESVEVKTRAFAKLYEGSGPEVVEKVVAHHLAHGGVSRFEKIKHYHRDFLGRDIDEDELQRLCGRFSDLVLEGVVTSPLVPGAMEALEAICRKYDCYVVSGTPEDELKLIVGRRNLGQFFREVRGAPAKKHDIISDIMRRHGYRPEDVVFIGDAMTDYNAARATSTKFIGRVPEGEDGPFPPGTLTVTDLTP